MVQLAEKPEYQSKNILLNYPADWYIQDKTFNAVKESLPKIIDFYENKGNTSPKKNELSKIIKEPFKDVYTVPFFSEKYCKILVDEISHLENFYGFDE